MGFNRLAMGTLRLTTLSMAYLPYFIPTAAATKTPPGVAYFTNLFQTRSITLIYFEHYTNEQLGSALTVSIRID
jgi:hypothetical protein